MPSIQGPLRCPICERENPRMRGFADRAASEIVCSHCGTFVIARDLVVIELERSPLKGRREGLTVEDERLLPYLSAYIRQANSRGITPELNRDNWRDFARAHQTTPVPQKVEKLL